MSKRLFMPRHLNTTTLREEEQTLCGYTGDGHVGFTVAGIDLVNRIEISHEAAMALARELLSASYDASRIADEAAGLNEWVSRPFGDGRYEVHYHGHAGIFRPIVNGKRRNARRYADPSQAPKGVRCTVCRREAPEGATMYVFDKTKKKPDVYDANAGELGWHRACQSCVRPDLHAAVVGAALLAKVEER